VPKIVDKEEKRKKIIKAAMNVFSSTGFRHSKIKDIAGKAKVGKGTVYEYFKSKQDLFLQMSEHLYEEHVLAQIRELDPAADPEEQIRNVIASTFRHVTELTSLTYLYIDVWSQMGRQGEEDDLRQLLTRVYQRTTEMLSGYISKAQARGAFKDYDPDLVALTILAALDGLMFQLLIKKDMFELKPMIDTFTNVLFEGLKK
jgi:AcrR family transcriptional regulator